MGQTLFEKILNKHIVTNIEDDLSQLYIDRMYCHEVTSPQAFDGLRKRGLNVFRPDKIVCIPDHNIPTQGQNLFVKDTISKKQIDILDKNVKEFGIKHYYPMCHDFNGITHVVGPELGFSLPGMTIVCGDSHTSTHGALGAMAFGIGTSDVEMVLATQCMFFSHPKTMRVVVNGRLNPGVTSKDVALYIISKVTTGWATGYFVEYAGETIKNLSMESRLTLCNLSIEMGAIGGIIAPDEITFEYIKNCQFAPKGKDLEKYLNIWTKLKTDDGAYFDKEIVFDASKIEPMVTYGTNPGMGIGINDAIPTIENVKKASQISFFKALKYMNFKPGEKILGKPVDYIFLGSCTNGRIEDFRTFSNFVKGKKKSKNVVAWLVPGSWKVEKQIREEGLDKILNDSGFEIRQPGCSACLAMNEDKIPNGKYVVSTSNRNFEGRQGEGARTILSGVLVAAAASVTGEITDPRTI
ncbi:MAG: 3-isopropylmalate dehydratase large subunit [Bacteroidales bacterium OttesenSCG-928-I14]|jgi:3-isopropylmalate/(R)-2-methylmalate dehydratase large subunit|nr:3-isopropylmalate dehydratase large subunit [Bacteroidales bacterium OttesenSCG-928-I14]